MRANTKVKNQIINILEVEKIKKLPADSNQYQIWWQYQLLEDLLQHHQLEYYHKYSTEINWQLSYFQMLLLQVIRGEQRQLRRNFFTANRRVPQQKYKVLWVGTVEFLNEGTTVISRSVPIQTKILVMFPWKVFLHHIKQSGHRGEKQDLQQSSHVRVEHAMSFKHLSIWSPSETESKELWKKL